MSSIKNLMNIDPQKETERIVEKLRHDLSKTLKKRGAVIGISGGIDSSVILALCAKAFGPKKVLGIMLPEKESSKDNFALARELAKTFEVDYIIEDIDFWFYSNCIFGIISLGIFLYMHYKED